ncbi:MAG: aminotransferase class IV [Myxococcota bacterium]
MTSNRPALPIWIDGELRPREAAALRGDDSAALEGRGCYTTARVSGGAVLWAERHARRLDRDANTLGLGAVDRGLVERAFGELTRAAFGRGEGAIRLQASCDGSGRLHLLGIPRELGDEPALWRAVSAESVHPGVTPWSGVKVTNRLEMGFARQQAARRGVDEAILFDRDGFAVEGSRSNLLFVGDDDRVAALDPRRGAVAGIALEVLREALPDLPLADLPRPEALRVRELIAVNSLRGARPVVELDGALVGDGAPGPWSRRLASILESVEPG